MSVSAVMFTAPCQPALGTVELPSELEPNQIRYRTVCSGISIGTERLLWEGRLDYAKFPQVLGYQAIGVVEEVGAEIDDVAVGQPILTRRSLFQGEAVHPVSGTHVAAGVVERGQFLPAPPGIDPLQASIFVLPCVGYHGVAMAQVTYGEVVAVQGCGLVGLAVVAAARLRGARIVALDPSPRRREAALALGADLAVDPQAEDALEVVKSLDQRGADVVFEATGFGQLLDAAFALARTHGRFVFQGNYGGDKPIEFMFIPPHGRQLTCYFPCNDGLLPCRRAVTQLMARGQLDFSPAISHVVSPAGAVEIYKEIIAGHGAATSALGVVIDWREGA